MSFHNPRMPWTQLEGTLSGAGKKGKADAKGKGGTEGKGGSQ